MEFNNLVEGILQSLNETKEAPDGYYYTEKGNLRKGNPASDGRGGPKYASDPTDRKNYGPRENNEERKKGKKKKKGLTGLALLAQQEQGEKRGRDGRGLGPNSREDFIYQSPYDNTEAKLKAAAEEEGIYVNLDIEGGLVDPREVHDLLKDTPDGSPVTDDDVDRVLGGMKKPAEDAEYRGRKVSLNKPTRGDVKKFKVYVKDQKSGNVKKVNFGHGGTSAKRKGEKTMKIRKSNPKARKSFRARHNCDNPGPKTKARYWSCKKW